MEAMGHGTKSNLYGRTDQTWSGLDGLQFRRQLGPPEDPSLPWVPGTVPFDRSVRREVNFVDRLLLQSRSRRLTRRLLLAQWG